MRPLELHDLGKGFRRATVLDGLGLALDAGEVLGLVGPNGAGKSTLMRCIVGLYVPDTGRVLVDGVDALAEPVRARTRLSYLPGETSLYEAMTGQELLDFALAFHPALDGDMVRRCAEAFPLPLDARVRTYSSGMKQKLALRVALAPDVPLLLLDEPDRALDRGARDRLYALIRALRARGRGVLLSSHHLDELEEVADRTAFLVHGHLAGDAEVAGARTRLARVLEAGFERVPEGLALPGGLEVEWDGPRLRARAADDATLQAAAARLAAAGATSLSFGGARLMAVYDALYAAGRTA
ncbi:MAG: ATP-binding cassette domain-containing protein [Planctomycetota bacterium]